MRRRIAASWFWIVVLGGCVQAQPYDSTGQTGAPPVQAYDPYDPRSTPSSGQAGGSGGNVATTPATRETFSQQEILNQVEGFFGQSVQQLALAVQQLFREQGEPNGYIAGEEFGAALGIGVRYGRGKLTTRRTQNLPVFWQGPSIGFDLGVNVAKVFILVYHLPSEAALFQRFPGVEGSLYVIGGVGVNYLKSGNTVVAPIRLGAGWRQGVSAGYISFTRTENYNPF